MPHFPYRPLKIGQLLPEVHFVSRGRPRACPTAGNHKGCPYVTTGDGFMKQTSRESIASDGEACAGVVEQKSLRTASCVPTVYFVYTYS